MEKRVVKKIAGISSEAVAKATGKTWKEWILILDKNDCKKMNHKEIVSIVHNKYGIGSWWQQMVTVGYEQARGLREKHQTATGYEISVSKTIDTQLVKLYKAWEEIKIRKRWLDEHKFVIRKSTTNKSIRAIWIDGKTLINVNFYSKGENKSTVVVQHLKISSLKEASKMKKYWDEKLKFLSLIFD